MNQVFVIKPYRHHGTWVFDDPAVGLDKEPFVAGVPEMIDHLVGAIPGAERGFRLLFSAERFPGALARLEHANEEIGGHWYRMPDLGAEGWLCPAMFKYFDEAPSEIWIRPETLEGSAPAPPGHAVVTADEIDLFEARLIARDYDALQLMVTVLRQRVAGSDPT